MNLDLLSLLQRHRKKIIVSILLLIVIFAVFFISTNGYLVIKSRDNVASVYATKIDGDKKYERKLVDKNTSLLSVGSYIIEYKFNNGVTTLQQIDVSGFLQKKTVDSTQNTYTSTTLSSDAGLFSGPVTPTGVETFDYNGGVAYSNFKQKTTDSHDLNIPRFDDFTYLTDSLIAGYILSSSVVTPFTYDFSNNEVKYFGTTTINTPTTPVSINRIDKNRFALYIADKGLLVYSRTNVEKTIQFKSNKPALFNNKPLVDTNPSSIVSITGQDKLLSSDGDNESSSSNTFTLRLYSLDGKTTQAHTISDELVRKVALSSKSTHTAIIESSSLEIVDNKTGKSSLTITQPVEDVRWLNDSTFVFSTTKDHQVFIGDTTNGVRSVYPRDTVNITAFSYIDNDKVIFSALPVNNGVKINPNLYAISLTPVQNNTISSLPHQGEGFYIYELNNVIYIQLTRYIDSSRTSVNEDSRKQAYDYLRKNGINNPTVEEFTDIDLR